MFYNLFTRSELTVCVSVCVSVRDWMRTACVNDVAARKKNRTKRTRFSRKANGNGSYTAVSVSGYLCLSPSRSFARARAARSFGDFSGNNLVFFSLSMPIRRAGCMCVWLLRAVSLNPSH